jgi:hypothetical protein
MVKVAGILAVALALAVVTASKAEATASLRLTQGASVVTIVDGDGDGEITFLGAVGLFTLNVTTGLTKPDSGSASSPRMILDSFSQSSGGGPGPRTLVIEFTDTSFAGPEPGLSMSITGNSPVAGASVTYQAYFDAGDGAFVQGPIINQLGPFLGPGGFSQSANGAGPVVAVPYSLTQVVTIVHNGSGTQTTTFNAQLIPEPALLSLFGLGLAGFGIAAKRRRVKVQAV